MFDWLKKILGIPKKPSSPKLNKKKEKNPCDELDEKKKKAEIEKWHLTQSSTDWYFINIPQESNQRTSEIFHAKNLGELPTLKSLKDERLKKEVYKLQLLKEEVLALLKNAENHIAHSKADKAQQSLCSANSKIVRVKDAFVKQRYIQIQNSLTELEYRLEQERLARLAEKQKQEAEEKRKREETAKRIKKEQERQAAEERRKKLEEADRRAAEARKKEQAEQLEKQRLEKLSADRKENWNDFYQVLTSNSIRHLYHFTDKRNIPSIKRHGGLFSWHYCQNNNITIPCQGGDYDSRELDKKYGLEDYVRLSFCDDHPMAYRLQKSGSDIVILHIKIDVALLKDTLFSDINAADKLHTHGGGLEDLKRVNFEATKRHHVSRNDEDFKPHQAEVMVKTFVPLKYIENI